jgi:hypothetical protein
MRGDAIRRALVLGSGRMWLGTEELRAGISILDAAMLLGISRFWGSSFIRFLSELWIMM